LGSTHYTSAVGPESWSQGVLAKVDLGSVFWIFGSGGTAAWFGFWW
jgi:hypothetical protein